jgi:short-chain fatty acids transporter
MLRRLGDVLNSWSRKYVPDPYVFAILLTILTFILGIFVAKNTPFQMILHWQAGFWNLLTFSMQMALILVTGHAVASSPLVRRWLKGLARIPGNSRQAVYLVGFVACLMALINWGLGLIVGALLAREVAREGRLRGIKMHYPLIVAAGYLGLMVWHGGFSASAPLLVATEGHFLQDKIGLIAVSQTLFSPLNLAVSLGLLVLAPLFAMMLHPKDEVQEINLADFPEEEAEPQVEADDTPASRLENSYILTWIIGLGGLVFIVYHSATKGFDLNLNFVNWFFLFIGIVLHGTPVRYVHAVAEAARGVSGIILQFPFYAGIMGMMGGSGLVQIIADWFVSISTATTYPIFSFISAGLVNLFVPSGGGQWAVQGPIMVEAAPRLGVSYAKTIMSVAYGDQLTNMLQPFWAIALLGITKLRARDIIGYTLGVMLLSGIYIILCILIFPA